MRFLLLWLSLILFSACGTVQDHRIRQYSRDYAKLPEAAQIRVKEGIIQIGDTPLMVYLALGYAKTEMTTESGELVWTYWAELEPRPDLPHDPRFRFYTQNEMRFPALSKLYKLTLTFNSGKLTDFKTEPSREAY